MRKNTASETIGGIPPHILKEIRRAGKNCGISRIILFGSRARQTNTEKSDIDLAFPAKDASSYFAFTDALENIDTLLLFDAVDMNGISYSHDLNEEIKKDGIIIYENL